MTEEQNVVAVPIKGAVKNGAKLIVIDQRETELTRFADIWLRPNPGSETALVGGMLRAIMDESLEDHSYAVDRCEGLDDLRRSLWSFDLLRVESETAVPQDRIRQAARLFATNGPASVLYGLETLAADQTEECVRALVNLSLLTGNFGVPSGGVYPLFTGANLQGSMDIGCSPEHLPGYAPLRGAPGVGIRELAEAIRGKRIRALQIIGDSPSFTNGDLGEFVEALKELDFLLVQDTFPSEVSELADVVLPSATFAEKDGTYTNIERRVQLLRPVLGPKAEEEPDWRILCRIAERMGAPGFDFKDSAAVFNEFAAALPDYAGLSHRRLLAGGIQWPCPDEQSRGTAILGAEAGVRPRMSPVALRSTARRVDSEYPFLLARGRVLHQPNIDAGVHLVDTRYSMDRETRIELHQEDARELGVGDGERVEVIHPRGALSGVARLNGPLKGVVSTTGLFGELILDLESSELPDPMLRTPGLPMLPARVAKPAAVAAD
jgi:predicted molibdopterin-dependent oxidoreductase YjgC